MDKTMASRWNSAYEHKQKELRKCRLLMARTVVSDKQAQLL